MHSRLRGLARDLVATLAILVLGLSLALAGRVLGDANPTESIDALLGLAASTAGLVVVGGWLAAMSLAAAAALLDAAGRHGPARWAAAVTPAFMRRLAFGVLGASLLAGPTAHASSGDLDPAWRPSPAATAQPTFAPIQPGAFGAATESGASGTPTQSLPTARADSTPPARAAPDHAWTPPQPVPLDNAPSGGPLVRPELRVEASGRGAVEVRPGDTLWSIAARHLGPNASVSDVANAWPRWFESNRAAIGDDPDLIRPGLLLVPPNG
ncbi:LysM peptidoglycan-binding domain-containing protein [Sinomonas sp. P47F7]|uniref:LysM peptidoglycan-binding domain-containing protein n=1 Tax=Sinomonas sp. P47F7 TaxID=3410987 RepID=UPI003BF5DF56